MQPLPPQGRWTWRWSGKVWLAYEQGGKGYIRWVSTLVGGGRALACSALQWTSWRWLIVGGTRKCEHRGCTAAERCCCLEVANRSKLQTAPAPL